LLTAFVTVLTPITTLAEVTYDEQDSGANMGQSFTGSAKVVYGQAPSFTVKIPKTIALDEDGSAKYTVRVKGQILSKYVVNVVSDESGNNVITFIVFRSGVKVVGDCADMFCCYESLVSIDLLGLDTSQVTSMDQMFNGCSSLTSIKVSSATWVESDDTGEMFDDCGVSSVTKVSSNHSFRT